jgi:hypothetical protein
MPDGVRGLRWKVHPAGRILSGPARAVNTTPALTPTTPACTGAIVAAIPSTKVCTKCLAEKPLERFNAERRQKDGRRARCQVCERADTNEYRQRRDEAQRARAKAGEQRWRRTPKGRAVKRRERLRRSFGISITEYDQILAAQNGCCAICCRPEIRGARGGGIKHLAVDHDHAQGTVRGLLCHSCNIGLGNFGDDLELVEKAAAYLRQHSKGKEKGRAE